MFTGWPSTLTQRWCLRQSTSSQRERPTGPYAAASAGTRVAVSLRESTLTWVTLLQPQWCITKVNDSYPLNEIVHANHLAGGAPRAAN